MAKPDGGVKTKQEQPGGKTKQGIAWPPGWRGFVIRARAIRRDGDVFSLPSNPLKYSLVKVPKGTKIREGTAGKIWVNDAYWGHGGGKQYQIMDWDNIDPLKKNKWFSKEGVKL